METRSVFFILISLLLCMNSYSQDSKYGKLLSLCGNVGHNGGCSISTYSVTDVDYKKEVKNYIDDISDSEMPIFRMNEVTTAIESAFAVGNSTEQEEFIEELASVLGSAKFIVGIIPHPGNCEDSEYCSFARIRIFTKDGYVIDIDIDHTT